MYFRCRVDAMDNLLATRHDTPWQLIRSYWQSEQRGFAYWLVITILFLTVGLVGFDVTFNYWYNHFYNALQAYDRKEAIRLLGFFFILAAFYLITAVYRFYLSQWFGLRWRRWLTSQLMSRWLQHRGYYYLEHFDRRTDNPEQRLQEDVGSLATYSIDLCIGLISAVTTFLAFIYVLWHLSGTLPLSLGRWGIVAIPGYLVWVVVIYTLVGTFFTFKIGRPLIALNFEQQKREATFRFAATDLRSHAEHVALSRGELHQKKMLQRLLGRVIDNYYFIIVRQKMLLWFTAGYNQLSIALPLVVALPRYFDKVFLLGGLMQTLQAFGRVQESLSFIVNAYTQIAQWQAVTQRLTTFAHHLNEVEARMVEQNQVVFRQHRAPQLLVKQLTLYRPTGEVLLAHINETLIHGQHYLIQGASGIGKSTFIRTLAGLWPYATGEIVLPTKSRMMYVPQKLYMPLGTLAETILFPDQEKSTDPRQLEQVLRDCHLEKLIPLLRETMPWSEYLSPGEQQRIAFARVFIYQPDWVFLDESTAMLDAANEKHLYTLLQTVLPHCSLVSVGHQNHLTLFHHIIDMTPYSVHQTH
jgi:vitamin B12/bleomycin/antimicrobial peptide transport system ATP-binding/permease protein